MAFLLVNRRSPVATCTWRAQRRGRAPVALVFGVLFVHSLPEGFAIGTAFASDTEGLGLFVLLAIALQNVPEGTASRSRWRRPASARAAVLGGGATSAPQPVAGGGFVLVEEIEALLPFSFAFAAGAMLALVVLELAPQAYVRGRMPAAVAGTLVGAGLMLVLAALLGV